MARFFLICLTIILGGCQVMPGMQNPNLATMKQAANYPSPIITPTVIPITPALVSSNTMTQYEYHVTTADILEISVWRHPEFLQRISNVTSLTGSPSTQGAAGREGYLVDARGFIYFPLIGKIHVAGYTTEQIRVMITRRLTKYVRNPQLNVRVTDFRGQKIYAFGEILKPGFVPLSDQPLSITDAISLTGGFDQNAADPAHIYVIRGNLYNPRIYWLNAKNPQGLLLAERFILKPGDILYVSSAAATRWNRVINQLLPTVQTVWYTKAIVDTN
jgi:polysaccharide export outer membrane protein